jgi:hypothetical protein
MVGSHGQENNSHHENTDHASCNPPDVFLDKLDYSGGGRNHRVGFFQEFLAGYFFPGHAPFPLDFQILMIIAVTPFHVNEFLIDSPLLDDTLEDYEESMRGGVLAARH